MMRELTEAEPAGAIPDGIATEIDAYHDVIREFRAGDLGDVKMQKLRLQFGTYAQRQEGVQMQRIKIPGGILSAAQLERLADAADRYGSGFLHFTTREDVQIYYVRLDEVPSLLRFLAEAGITTREACGNTVRNITACYRAGTSPTEAFDVTPYSYALFRFLVRNKYNQVLGRKFKITFEGCAEDHSGVRIHDIGFVARKRREGGIERRGFQVHLGGGLGGAPMLSHLYTEFLPVEEMFNFAAAILRLFDRYGERKSRMKARMKFLIQSMGWDPFRRLLDEERERVGPIPVEDRRGARVHPSSRVRGTISASWTSARKRPISPGGIGIPSFRTACRACAASTCASSWETSRPSGRARWRDWSDASPPARHESRSSRTSIFPGSGRNRSRELHGALKQIGLADPGAETVSDITTCPGSDTCRLGIASAKGLGSTLENAFEGRARRLSRGRAKAQDQDLRLPERLRAALDRRHRVPRSGADARATARCRRISSSWEARPDSTKPPSDGSSGSIQPGARPQSSPRSSSSTPPSGARARSSVPAWCASARSASASGWRPCGRCRLR